MGGLNVDVDLPMRAVVRVAAVLAAALGITPAPAARGQLSPGPLSRPHAQLEGAARCLDCHQPGKGVVADKCLDCHSALGRRIAAGRGLHATPGHKACATCHVEHHGRDFQLVWWGEEGRDAFDHRRAGWALQGAHASVDCRDCHRPESFSVRADTLTAAGADSETTFLGLSTACVACHRDEHRGQFELGACASCHSTRRFVPADRFDHSDTAFPLTGGHAEVACGRCHQERHDPRRQGDDLGFLQLVGVEHASCANCHQDPHAGRLGADCASCHDAAGWGRIRQGGFDHSLTGFPLTGRHARLSCASCHGGRGERRGLELRHGSCANCHRDPHAGRLGATCTECHNTSSWRQVDGDRFDHDRARFPLTGAHRQVACASCHPPGRPATAAPFESCADCHRDPHLGASGPAAADGCESCHTTSAFSPSTFTVVAHGETTFPLTGAHLATPCTACHRATETPETAAGGDEARMVPLRFQRTDCAGCHEDPHGGSTERWEEDSGCRSCHDDSSWRRIAFDHQRTGFTLRGAHTRLACAGCHRPQRRDGRTVTSFSGLPNTCESCHAASAERSPRERPEGAT